MKKLFFAALFAVTALSLFAANAPSLQPAQGWISPLAEWTLASPFGERINPLTGTRGFHSAIDMSAPLGTPISAAQSGTVLTTGYSNVYGNYVVIDHGSGYQSLYGRMSKILTQKGANVEQGTEIGLVGSTGYSAGGPHLHFTVYKDSKPVDPLPLFISASFGANNAQKTPQIGAIVIAAVPQESADVNPEQIDPFDFSASWPVKVKEAHNMTGKLGGVILAAEKGEPVKSVTTGWVIYSGLYRGFGHVVFVRAGDGSLYVYAGCENLRVKTGDKVSPGTELGYVGIDPLSKKPQLFFIVYTFPPTGTDDNEGQKS